MKSNAKCHPDRLQRRKDGLCDSCRKKFSVKFPPSAEDLLAIQENRIARQSLRAYYAEQRKLQVREYELKRTYGISLLDVTNMYRMQNGACAICQHAKALSELYVDHNHRSGKVRGLLCPKCNTALGMINENRQAIYNMLGYLDDPPASKCNVTAQEA